MEKINKLFEYLHLLNMTMDKCAPPNMDTVMARINKVNDAIEQELFPVEVEGSYDVVVDEDKMKMSGIAIQLMLKEQERDARYQHMTIAEKQRLLNERQRALKDSKPKPLKFEVGKFYKHTAGTKIAVLCEADTTLYGNTLLAESAGCNGFRAVGKDESCTANWHEITKEEWMQSFSG